MAAQSTDVTQHRSLARIVPFVTRANNRASAAALGHILFLDTLGHCNIWHQDQDQSDDLSRSGGLSRSAGLRPARSGGVAIAQLLQAPERIETWWKRSLGDVSWSDMGTQVPNSDARLFGMIRGLTQVKVFYDGLSPRLMIFDPVEKVAAIFALGVSPREETMQLLWDSTSATAFGIWGTGASVLDIPYIRGECWLVFGSQARPIRKAGRDSTILTTRRIGTDGQVHQFEQELMRSAGWSHLSCFEVDGVAYELHYDSHQGRAHLCTLHDTKLLVEPCKPLSVTTMRRHWSLVLPYVCSPTAETPSRAFVFCFETVTGKVQVQSLISAPGSGELSFGSVLAQTDTTWEPRIWDGVDIYVDSTGVAVFLTSSSLRRTTVRFAPIQEPVTFIDLLEGGSVGLAAAEKNIWRSVDELRAQLEVSKIEQPVVSEYLIPKVWQSEIVLNKNDSSNLLGRGAFASVWACTLKPGGVEGQRESNDSRVGKVRALKEFEFNSSGNEIARLSRAVTEEAELMFNLHHPNVARIEAFVFNDDSLLCGILMEKYEFPLDVLINEQDEGTHWFSGQTGVTWMYQLASALAYAHSLGISHRDLKTNNVLSRARVFPPGAPRPDNPGSLTTLFLTDFGVGKLIEESSVGAVLHTITGTPGWWAPEMDIAYRSGQRSAQIDPFKCDIFSLGMIGWALMTGRQSPTFWTLSSTQEPANAKYSLSEKMAQVKFQVCRAEWEALHDIISGRCILVGAEHRYSAKELRQRLARFDFVHDF